MKPIKQLKKDARAFSKRWTGKGDEREDYRNFWLDLTENVFGLENVLRNAEVDKVVQTIRGQWKHIDFYMYPPVSIIAVQKDPFVEDLDAVYFNQALIYVGCLVTHLMPRYVILCNFKKFQIYDRAVDTYSPQATFPLDELAKNIQCLEFIAQQEPYCYK